MTKILILGVLVAAAWRGFSTLERRSLYFPDRLLLATPAAIGASFEDLTLRTADGIRLHAWYLPGPPTSPVLLVSHGNAGNISHRLEKARRLLLTGAGVLLYDYRGYGRSEGTPSEAGTYRDAEAVYRYLTETRGIPARRIFLYGESLGCAIATELAMRHPAAGLILESPFTSTLDMARIVFPWLPVRWIVRYRYDTLSKIPRLGMPLVILHSRQDEIVPFAMGERLLQAAPEPKRLIELVGGHNDGFIDSGARYSDAIQEAIGRAAFRRPPPDAGGDDDPK